MARGSTLLELTDALRSEIGASPNPAQNPQSVPYWQQLLRRTQRRLYAKRKWGFLWVERDKALQNGERYYSFPADLIPDEITQAWRKYNGRWVPLGYGINPLEFNCQDSDLGAESSPVLRWDRHEDNQFEVWPIPQDDTQILRFYGYKNLAPLVDNTDRADLDEDLIVLFAAAEILERDESDDAKSKAALAQDHYMSCVKNDSKPVPFTPGGPIPAANQDTAFPRAWGDYPLYGGKI